MFERYDHKVVVLAIFGRFHELLSTVWDSRVIYMFERYVQKVIVLAFYGRSHELLPIVLASRAIYMV